MSIYYDKNKVNYDLIINDYNNRYKHVTIKSIRLWLVILAFYIAIVASLMILVPRNAYPKDLYTVSRFFYVLLLIALIVGFSTSMYFGHLKVFNTFVIHEMIDYFNLKSNLSLVHDAYPKKQDFVNRKGGLFTRLARTKVTNKISGATANNHVFSYYNMKLTVSNGKSQVTVFKGMYFVIDIPLAYQFQLRTHSSPKLKGYNFQRVDKDNPVKVYVLKDDDAYDRQNPFIFMISEIKQDIVAKKLYLSAVANQIHFAYEGTTLLQKPKSLDATALDALVDDISLILSVIDRIEKTSN